MKIAIVGTRGIPGRYGGFETFAEQLSTRLVKRGHDVIVYGRGRSFLATEESAYEGVTRISAWTLFTKHIETPLAALSSFIDLVFRRDVDVVLLCNAANSIFAFIPRLFRVPIVINVDGIERKRAKWGAVARLWYRAGEFFSVLFGTRVIADAYSIAEYYGETYGSETEILAYGAEATEGASDVLTEFGLEKGEYFLYVSRLEPENNALGVIQAYNESQSDRRLVIVGDAPYANEYRERLSREASDGVIFTGYQFGEAYHILQSNCYLYIQATEVGGTHPALIESMAHGNCILANGVPEHYEVLRGGGVYYNKNDYKHLAELFRMLTDDKETVGSYGKLAKEEASKNYQWDTVTLRYEELFKEVSR